MKSSARAILCNALLGVALVVTASHAAEPNCIGPAAPAAVPRHESCIVIGPGGGAGQFYPAVSPHDTTVVLVGCEMTGPYITADGGESWPMFNLRCASDFFYYDPVDPSRLYLSSWGRDHADGALLGGIWLSKRAGEARKNVFADDQYIYDVLPWIRTIRSCPTRAASARARGRATKPGKHGNA